MQIAAAGGPEATYFETDPLQERPAQREATGTPSNFRYRTFLDRSPTQRSGGKHPTIAKELRVTKNLVHDTLKNISPPAPEFHGSED